MRNHAIAIGAGFFALSAFNAAYDSFLPLFLRNFVPNLVLIGFLMTVDNYIGLIFQPWWGAHSDGASTRFGRRLPYLIIGMPIAGGLTLLVPFAAQVSLVLLVGVMITLNLTVSVWRAPLLALLADMFPQTTRSTASGITYFMGALGGATVLLGGSLLFGTKGYAPFVLVALACFGAVAIMAWAVREPASPSDEPRRSDPLVVLKALRHLAALPQKDALIFLGGAFCFQLALNGAHPYFTIYVRDLFSLTPGEAGALASGHRFGALLAMLPAGFLAARYGRQQVMLPCLLVLSLVLFSLSAVTTPLLVGALWSVAGVCAGAIVVTSIVVFLSFAGVRETGLFTGLHLAATAAAQIISPPVWGQLMELFGLQTLWIASGSAAALAALLVSRVREPALSGTEIAAQPVGLGTTPAR